MKVRRKHKDATDLHFGPLNDILFILLLFFLIVATMANPNVVKVTSPKGKSDSKINQSIVVSVDSANKMFLGTTMFSKDSIENVLTGAYLKDTSNKAMVINGDIEANFGAIMEVLRIAKKMGFTVAFNVEQ
jgi:biopolymer transport protein ExbD